MGGGRTTAAVIGAGAGGISAARHLIARGIETTVFELGSHAGGLWVYENDNGRSPTYDSLHINSEARITAFPDLPFPDGTPLFPSHRQVAAYLQAYADGAGVTERIRFNAAVTAVEPAGAGWELELDGGDRERFDAVVVATGHQAVPAHPPFARDFAGDYRHAHDYRTPEAYRGRRVLVLGTGNSALDIAADVCHLTERTVVSARSPVLVMPRTMFGMPTARVLTNLKVHKTPWPLQRRIRELLTWIAHGRMERWGLRTPKTRTHPAGHQTFMSHVAYERIAIRPGVAGVDGDEVRFADGRAERFDVMIAATGYEIDLPLLGDLAPVVGRSLAAFKRVVHPDHPGLYFVGYFNVSGGANIRMMDVQANWVGALIAGEAGLPDRAAMVADIERDRRVVAERYPDPRRYGLELDPLEYPQEIAAELQRPAGASPQRRASPERSGAAGASPERSGAAGASPERRVG